MCSRARGRTPERFRQHLILTSGPHFQASDARQNIYVTLYLRKKVEMQTKTGAERYFESRGKTGAYRDAYHRERESIDEVDRIVDAIEERRLALGLSKAELARRVGSAPESVRRLLSDKHSNPTLSTIVSLAKVLDMDIVAVTKRKRRQTA